jgi:hypothetical protein
MQTNKQNFKALQAISESNTFTQSSSIISWSLQHISQIIELALKVSFTKQIETHLGDGNELSMLVSYKASSLFNLN